MKSYGAALAALAILLAVLATGAVAQAQQDLRIAEVITGRGAAGPYALSWTNIEAGSEWVSVDGMSLVPQVDYALDAQSGAIAFTRPLASGHTARVVYFRRPDSAPKQAGPTLLTVTTPSLLTGRSAVNLTASYSEAGPAPAVAYGLQAKTAASKNSALETTLLVSHRREQGSYGPGAFGWRTAASTTVGGLKLSGAIAQAEEGFANSNSLGLSGAGLLTTAQAEYQAGPHLALASSYASAETQTGETVTSAQRVSYRASSGLGLTATRAEQRSGGQISQTEAVELTSRPADRVDLRAQYRQSALGDSITTTQEVETSIRPTSSLSLGAGWVRQESGSAIQGQKATIAWTPSKRLQLQGEYLENPQDPSGRVQQATASRLGVSTSLGSLGLSASTWNKDETTGRSQRHDLSLALTLSQSQKLLFGYSIETSPSPTTSLDRNTYIFGYTLGQGADLSLSIGAQLLTYRGTAQSVTLPSETRANAKLTTRF